MQCVDVGLKESVFDQMDKILKRHLQRWDEDVEEKF